MTDESVNDDVSLAEVISLGEAAAPATERERPYPACDHARVEVDRAAGALECRDCKARVDPLWWIGQLARRWKQTIANPTAIARRDRERVSDSLAELQAEEKRTRARLARLRNRDDEPARQPFPSDLLTEAKRQSQALVRVQVEQVPYFGNAHDDGERGHAEVCALVDISTGREVIALVKRLLAQGGRGQAP